MPTVRPVLPAANESPHQPPIADLLDARGQGCSAWTRYRGCPLPGLNGLGHGLTLVRGVRAAADPKPNAQDHASRLIAFELSQTLGPDFMLRAVRARMCGLTWLPTAQAG